jgi:hypothetical protein
MGELAAYLLSSAAISPCASRSAEWPSNLEVHHVV